MLQPALRSTDGGVHAAVGLGVATRCRDPPDAVAARSARAAPRCSAAAGSPRSISAAPLVDVAHRRRREHRASPGRGAASSSPECVPHRYGSSTARGARRSAPTARGRSGRGPTSRRTSSGWRERATRSPRRWRQRGPDVDARPAAISGPPRRPASMSSTSRFGRHVRGVHVDAAARTAVRPASAARRAGRRAGGG